MTRDRAILFDTETTGTEEGDAQIIEAAIGILEGMRLLRVDVERFKPSVPINLGAMATHHIIEQDLEHCRPSSEFALPSDVGVIIGHKVDFDWKMAGRPRVRRICTLALARKVWPSLDSYTLGAILYHVLPHPQAQNLLQGAHSAGVDVENLMRVLDALCEVLQPQSLEQLYRMSEEARIPEFITFGKYKAEPGEPPTLIVDLPRDYREWILRQSDMDPYLKVAVRRSFGQAAPMPRDEEL